MIARFRRMYESGERAEVICQEFKLTHSTLLTYAQRWGIRRLSRPKRRVLTDEEIRWLKAHYPTMSNDFCSRFLCLTNKTLREACRMHNIKKHANAKVSNISETRKSLFSGESRTYNYRNAVVVMRYDGCLGYRIRLDDGSEHDCGLYCRLSPQVGERVVVVQKKSPKCREFGGQNRNKIKIIKRLANE